MSVRGIDHPTLPDFHLIQSVTEMVTGAETDRRKRYANTGYDALREWDQQIQVAVSGTAGSVAAYQTLKLGFDVMFAIDMTNRDSLLVKPHFTYGFELVTGNPVAVTAMVTAWDQDQNGTYTGCTIAAGAFAPDLPPAPLAFSGFLHLNFQSYGAPPDVDETQLADDLGAD